MHYNPSLKMSELELQQATAEAHLAAAIAHAKDTGSSAAEAALSANAGLSVTVRNGALELVEHHQDKVLTVSAYRGQRKGTATTTDFSATGIAETVAAADSIARYAEEDPYAGLIDPARLAREFPDLDLDHRWDLAPQAAIDIAQQCNSAAQNFDPKVAQVDDVSVSRHQGLAGYANSDGFCASYRSSRHGISCVVIGESNGAMQRDYWYTVARDPQSLEAADHIGRRAAERTIAKLGARKLATEQVPVVFEAAIAASLIGHFVSAISGGALYRKASFLLDSIGRTIFPTHLNIDEVPHLARGLGSAPFDAEGAATSARSLVDKGVLQGYVLDSYAARRLGLESTGNAGGVHNLEVSHSSRRFAELLSDMGRGLLVTELMGFGVNLVTGDYSRGASGYWVENGEIAYPVDEITIAGKLSDMLKQIVAIGDDTDTRGNIRCGSILLESMTVAGS